MSQSSPQKYTATFQQKSAKTQNSSHELNCPCCDLKIVGGINYNMTNLVELKEVSNSAKKSPQKASPQRASPQTQKPQNSHGSNLYCTIQSCAICQGRPDGQELKTETKVVIHRDVSHECDLKCQFCNFSAADNRLLELLQWHHSKMNDLKRKQEVESMMENHRSDLFKNETSQLEGSISFQSPLKQGDFSSVI